MENALISLPSAVLAVMNALEEAGYSAYVVGGCVRDALRGVAPHDFDVTTSARPEEMMKAFSAFRVIPTGIEHGTLTVLSDGIPVEVTAYRVDGAYKDGRHPLSVTFTNDLRKDAARRDFTVNAMAWSPTRGLQDFFGGQEDLKAGIIRTVGNPKARFTEDALRILRALRFASVLGYTIDIGTKQAAFDLRETLSKISAERIREEFIKLLCGKDAVKILREYFPVICVFLPALSPMKGFAQNTPWHNSNVWEHTLRVLDAIPPMPPLRLAALFHDAGKPSVYSEDEKGVGHFYGHGKASVSIAEEALTALKTDNKLKNHVLTLVEYHDRKPENSDKAIRRLLAKLGEEAFFDLLELWRADCIGQAPMAQERLPLITHIRKRAEEICKESPCLTLRDLAIDGIALAEIGYARGPRMGDCLKTLLSLVIDGELENNPAVLTAYAKKQLKGENQ